MAELAPVSAATAPAAALPVRRRLRGPLGVRMRLFALLLALVVGFALWRVTQGAVVRAGALEKALAAFLEREGLRVDADSVRWLGPRTSALSTRPAIFLAQRGSELPDLYYADVRASRGGAVLDALFVKNLTRSSSATETQPTLLGRHLAFGVRVGDLYDAVIVLDTGGEEPVLTAAWPLRAKLQNAITNLQDSGRYRGFGRRRYQLVPAAVELSIGVEGNYFAIDADGETLQIDPDRLEPVDGQVRLRASTPGKGMPGTLTWLVDTVRNLSFVGAEPVAWLEHVVFGLTDRANRAYHGAVGVDTEAEVREALAVADLSPEREALLTAPDPELGWPPPALKPQLPGTVRGEGRWLPVVDDPFVNAYPNAPPAFYQTFLRVDPERDFTRVYYTIWDPRQVQLHIAMGTEEPESATGETGSGMIPRDSETVSRLVAGFNGGFQAMHGEFGMMSEGRVYLPPKPYAGTVAVYEDGRVAMGSWGGVDRGGWDEERANRQIPEDMVAMRQNLTSVVEGGRYNPWKRWWWGAAPVWAEEQTYIHRSGLCLTKDGHMAYLWGESMGPEELGKAMLAAHCERGLHLDMNSRHTGLEFYRPLKQGEAPLGRALLESEYEGPMPETPQAGAPLLRARKAVRTMTPLRFPRYVQRDPRDFFYLTLKPVLPGPDLRLGTRRIPFETSGLPHAGWPHAFARAGLRSVDGGGAWLVRIDATRALPTPAAAWPDETPGNAQGAQPGTAESAEAEPPQGEALAYLVASAPAGTQAASADTGPVPAALSLTRERGPASLLRHRLVPSKRLTPGAALLSGPPLRAVPSARAALGIDPDGFLVYGEVDAREPEGALAARLLRVRVREAIVVERLIFAADQRLVAVDGETEFEAVPPGALALRAEGRPAAEVLNPDVKPRPYRFWGWMQGRRVRYFPEGPPRFEAPEDVVEEATGGAPVPGN
ncbi:MAG: hypothetical protein OEZ06_05960 [Myxococcales bacterium]|nr:hypothetical protein [Myxococcales bacterium]